MNVTHSMNRFVVQFDYSNSSIVINLLFSHVSFYVRRKHRREARMLHLVARITDMSAFIRRRKNENK